MSRLNVFISYSSQDKLLAGLFKQSFEKYAGFSVFLAHEDIAPALEWQIKIIKKLKEAQVVIPLITDNYRNSEFTDQELGMAIALNKIVLPIKLSNINPYGFIKKIQALKCNRNEGDITNSVTTIVFVLINNMEFNSCKENVIDSVIEAFAKSNLFKTTRIIIRMLEKIESFTSVQISNLTDAIKNNNQIYEEYYAFPLFKKKLENKYRITIDI